VGIVGKLLGFEKKPLNAAELTEKIAILEAKFSTFEMKIEPLISQTKSAILRVESRYAGMDGREKRRQNEERAVIAQENLLTMLSGANLEALLQNPRGFLAENPHLIKEALPILRPLLKDLRHLLPALLAGEED
jgi:hypothetical protein